MAILEDISLNLQRGKAKVVMVGAKSAASGIADGASSLSGGLKGRLGRRK